MNKVITTKELLDKVPEIIRQYILYLVVVSCDARDRYLILHNTKLESCYVPNKLYSTIKISHRPRQHSLNNQYYINLPLRENKHGDLIGISIIRYINKKNTWIYAVIHETISSYTLYDDLQ